MLTMAATRAGRAAEYANSAGTRAFLIAQQGRIVFEPYNYRATLDSPLRIASGATGFCAGLLAAAGRCRLNGAA
jgi:hypothetical protein